MLNIELRRCTMNVLHDEKIFMQKEREYTCKVILLILLFAFSCVAIIFALYVLFSDIGNRKPISPEQTKGMFTVFIYKYINEVHPQKPAFGKTWAVTSLDFKSSNFAVVDATDSERRTRLEFVYAAEPPNIRVLRINDITGRDLQDAKIALIRYLDFMQSKNFIEAAKLYGGSQSRIQPYGKDGQDVASMLQGYCERVGPNGTCLKFFITQQNRDEATNSYKFTVAFLLPDGSTYQSPGGKQFFNAAVEERPGGEYVVITLPFD